MTETDEHVERCRADELRPGDRIRYRQHGDGPLVETLIVRPGRRGLFTAPNGTAEAVFVEWVERDAAGVEQPGLMLADAELAVTVRGYAPAFCACGAPAIRPLDDRRRGGPYAIRLHKLDCPERRRRDDPETWARPDGLDVGDDDPDALDEGAWHRARWLADAEDEAAGIAGREESARATAT